MLDPNETITAVVEAALEVYLRFRLPFSEEGPKCEVTCDGFRAKIWGGGDGTLRITVYNEPRPEDA